MPQSPSVPKEGQQTLLLGAVCSCVWAPHSPATSSPSLSPDLGICTLGPGDKEKSQLPLAHRPLALAAACHPAPLLVRGLGSAIHLLRDLSLAAWLSPVKCHHLVLLQGCGWGQVPIHCGDSTGRVTSGAF